MSRTRDSVGRMRTRISYELDHLVGDGTSDKVELELTHAPFRFERFNPKFDAIVYRPSSITVETCTSSVARMLPNDSSKALKVESGELLDNGRLGVTFSRALEDGELVLLRGWLYFNI